MSSSTTTAVTTAAHPGACIPINATTIKSRNDAYVAAWKKANSVKKQCVLPTKIEENNAWVLQQGWAQRDAIAWRNLCEKAKFSASVPFDADLDLLHGTLDVAGHVETHPIGLICFARTELKQQDWNLQALQAIRDRFIGTVCDDEVDEVVVVDPLAHLADGDLPDDDDASTSGNGKKRRRYSGPTQASPTPE